jgi:hypothetical protein
MTVAAFRWPKIKVSPTALRDRATVVLAALLPLVFLFDLGNRWNRDSDWGTHAWGVTYFAQFFAAHHYFSGFMNTAQWIGMPLPQFYAFSFYAATASLALVTGSDIALRLMVMAVALFVAFQVYATIRTLGGGRAAALCVTFAVSCAPYQLTNVFNRGDITEYVAVALVSIAVCAWLRFAFARKSTSRDAWLATLSYVAAASVHPITGLLGGVFCAAVFAALAIAGKRTMPALRLSVPAIILALAVLSPWLFNVARYEHQLHVVTVFGLEFIPGLDDLSNRLSPLVRDPRVENLGLIATSTPYLDAQVNFPLLALAALLVGDATLRLSQKRLQWSRGLTVVCGLIATFVLLTVASTVPSVGFVVLKPVEILQFVYRITNYLDLLLFVICALLLTLLRSDRVLFDRRIPPMLVVCTLLTLHGLLVKTMHSAALSVHPTPADHRFDYISDGHSLAPHYPAFDYGTAGKPIPAGDPTPHEAKDLVPISLPVYGGRDFGTVGHVQIFVRRTSFLTTNVLDFAENDLLIDGKPLRAADRFDDNGALAARVAPGRRTIGYAAHVGSVALLLRALSILAFGTLLWLVARPAARAKSHDVRVATR